MSELDDIFWEEGVYYEENTDKIILYYNGEISAFSHMLLGIHIMLQTPFGYAMSNYQFIYIGEF